MTLQDAVKRARLSLRPFAAKTKISSTQLLRLLHQGVYPHRIGEAETKKRISACLNDLGIDVASITWPGDIAFQPPRTSGLAGTTTKEEIELMSLDRNVLNLFGLKSNPFHNDVEADEDVLRYRGYEIVEQAIKDTIEQRGFLAVIADSGAGKTTIWDGIEAEYGGREEFVICKPNIKSREAITPEHLARTLIYGLAGDTVNIRANAEDRGRQLSHALRGIRTVDGAERKAVLYIDDAHFCSASVLRQLKTFFEEKIGRYRLLAIILVGLPTLKTKLSEFPEIGNRIRLVEVPPVPVEEYLAFKLKRAKTDIGRLFDEAGFDAFLGRFRTGRKPPLGRPLAINALCIRAMVRLYGNGAQSGERISREIMDTLPGGSAMGRAA